jgi:hypothetical protein
MGLDWLSKGKVIRSVAKIRKVMGDDDATNYDNWDQVIDQLGGATLGFSGEKTNDWQRVRDFVNNGGAAILAVDYGVYRRSMQNKSGSLTFNGYHAILFAGSRVRNGTRHWRSFDSLLDGRYRGSPNGPVWVPQSKVRAASEAALGTFAVLLHRDPSVGGIEPGDLLPSGGVSLADVLSDLNDVYTEDPSPGLARSIDDLEALLGITGNPEADVTTAVEAGVRVATQER